MNDETNNPKHFDPDGRDPDLVAFWRITLRYSDLPFRRAEIPVGMPFLDFWRDVLRGETTTEGCVERLEAYIESRPRVIEPQQSSCKDAIQRWAAEQRLKNAEKRRKQFKAVSNPNG